MEQAPEIIPYDPALSEEWDSFVESSNNGTIYHTQNFLAYHPENRFQNFHHLVRQNGKLCAIIPGAITETDRGKTFISYPGASVGGFVVPESFGLQETDRVVCAFLDTLKAQGFKRIELTLPPVFYARRQNNHIDFILSREGFGFKKREITSVITLHYPEGDILKTFDSSTRRSVKKSLSAGLEVVSDDSEAAYRNYYRILEQNLGLRHNVKPVHSVTEMLDIKHRFPDQVFLLSAMYKGEMTAGIWQIKINRDVSVAFYISHDPKFQELRPVNLLYYESLRKAVNWGQTYYELGLFILNMQPNYGLGRFKEGFGAQGLVRACYRKDFD